MISNDWLWELQTGDGLWLANFLLLALLCCYLWVLVKLISALKNKQLHTPQPSSLNVGKPQHIWAWCCAIGLLVFVPLLDYWHAGYSGNFTIAGIIPWSDAADWYHGAVHLKLTGEISDWSARRPLNTVLLFGLLQASGWQLKLALTLRAALLALTFICWCRCLRSLLPTAPAMGLGMLTLVLAYPYVPALLSESHGLIFALLGWCLILNGALNQRLGNYAIGAACIGAALAVRPGGFGMLLALLIWPLTTQPKAARWLFSTAFAIAVTALLSWLWGQSIYSGNNVTGANFSYTLYGLAHGGEPWQVIYQHHPELAQQPEAQQASFAYAAAWQQIQAHPGALVAGWWSFFGNYWRHLFVWVPGSLQNYLLPLFALGLIQLAWHWRNPLSRLTLMSFVGVLATAPWVFWSANAARAFIVTTPIELLIVGYGFWSILRLARSRQWALPDIPNAPLSPWLCWFTFAIAAASVTLLPWLGLQAAATGNVERLQANSVVTGAASEPLCEDGQFPLTTGGQVNLTVVFSGLNSFEATRPDSAAGYQSMPFQPDRVASNPIGKWLATQVQPARLSWVVDLNNPQRYYYLQQPAATIMTTPNTLCTEILLARKASAHRAPSSPLLVSSQ